MTSLKEGYVKVAEAAVLENNLLKDLILMASDDNFLVIFSKSEEGENGGRDIGTGKFGAKFALNCNDIFCYAADAEDFILEDVKILSKLHKLFGWEGPMAWISMVRGGDKPIKPLSEKYDKAVEFLNEQR
jgi:hypothetical protein